VFSSGYSSPWKYHLVGVEKEPGLTDQVQRLVVIVHCAEIVTLSVVNVAIGVFVDAFL
jgi:hypothetical protein